MASKAVIDAVAARLGATWNGLPVELPNTIGETPADGAAFISLQFPVANASRPTVNARHYREEGGFRIVFNGVRGSGIDGIDGILGQVEELSTLFRDQAFGGVTTYVPSPPVIDDRNESGNYFSVAIVVPYSFNF